MSSTPSRSLLIPPSLESSSSLFPSPPPFNDRVPPDIDPTPQILTNSSSQRSIRSNSTKSSMSAAASVGDPQPSSSNFSFKPELRGSSKATFPAEILPRSTSKPPQSAAALLYGSRRSDSRGASYKDINDDEARFVYINDSYRTNQPIRFPNNSIRTTKYTILTFLPRNLFEQFHRIAYVYFLVLAVLNQLPQLAVFGRETSILPLAFVLSVSAVKDGYEDWRRHRSDREENNRLASVFVGNEFQLKPWKDIRVGEVVKVTANETIPCDVVLLSTSEPTGVAYIQTVNLDGESNLKTRYAKQETLRLSVPSGLIRCERPNRNIYGFYGNMEAEDGKRLALGPSNIVLRGCELKNTSWVIGVAVYTGQETKVMLNNSGAPSKRSRLETHMNRETILLAILLFVLCCIVTVLGGVWLHTHRDELDGLAYYRKKDYSGPDVDNYNYYGIGWEVVFTFFKSVIVFQIMIPIALYVSMELVRLGQAFLMIQDKNMYDESRKTRFQSRALNINEDLGQIKYVFSDKTGTLTENKMEFRCASVRGQDYNAIDEDSWSISVDNRVLKPKMNVKTDPKLVELLKSRSGTKQADGAHNFFLALATCNTIVPLVVDTPDPKVKLIDYQGESPDEQALVYAAAAYGFVLLERTSGRIVVDVLGQKQRPKMRVKTNPQLVTLLRSRGKSEQAKHAHKLFLALAACNTIIPIVVDTLNPAQKLIDYQGESPDEQALVFAAASYGFVLVERTSGHIVIDVLGDRQRFDVLGLHEFDSDRKRMSVIVGCPDESVKLFVKGADSSMFGVVDRGLDSDVVHSTEVHLHAYSALGLRTLVIGMRELSSREFQEWQSAYEQASTAVFGRAGLLRAVAANIERNLQLLGASGIEDKLQEGVPEAIESLRQAGIKVWVLTGDKQETAISIGYSCKLLTSEMTQIIINSHSKASCKKSLEDALVMTAKISAPSLGSQNGAGDKGRVPLALIIDGTSLVYILETELEEELFKIATACDVVLCCRVAPLQKAGIVALIKNRTEDMTLAIGDGANDVSMIQMADVGIGISGQEGRQAVMASDFAMGQFRFLVPLLLVHGHWNYQRMAYLILYNFYRNAVFVFILFWYVLYTAFSLTTAITEWSSMLYSIVYTALPTIIVGILDKDLSRRTLLKYPQLYGAGQREERYNLKLFLLTMIDTVWQSTAVFFIPYLAYRHSTVDASSMGDLWTLAIVILVNIHLGMDVFRWNWMAHASIWGCIVATVICVIIIDSIPILPGYWAIFHISGTWLFWFCLLSILIVALLPRFVAKAFLERIFPNDIQVAREMEKFGNQNESPVADVQLSTFPNSHRGLTH